MDWTRLWNLDRVDTKYYAHNVDGEREHAEEFSVFETEQSYSTYIVQKSFDLIQRWFDHSFLDYNISEYYSDVRLGNRFSSDSIVPRKFEILRRNMFEKGDRHRFQDVLDIGKKLLRLAGLTYAVDPSRFSPWPLDPIDLELYHRELRRLLIDCAICSLQLKNNRQAIRYASEAIALEPSQASAPLFFRATAFFLEDCFQFGFTDYQRIETRSLYAPSAKLIFNEPVTVDSTVETMFEIYFKEKCPSVSYETEANDLFDSGCYMLASLFYTRSIDSNTNIEHCLIKRAECYRNMLQPEHVIEDCNRILFGQPNRLDALYLKARAYEMLGKASLFMEVMKQCLKMEPKNQILLDKYYSFDFRSMPRNKRRMRPSVLEHDQFHFDDHNDAFSVDHVNNSMIEQTIQGKISEFKPHVQVDFSAKTHFPLASHADSSLSEDDQV